MGKTPKKQARNFLSWRCRHSGGAVAAALSVSRCVARRDCFTRYCLRIVRQLGFLVFYAQKTNTSSWRWLRFPWSTSRDFHQDQPKTNRLAAALFLGRPAENHSVGHEKFHPGTGGKTVLLPGELGQNSARQTATPEGAGCLLFLSFTEAGHGNRRR